MIRHIWGIDELTVRLNTNPTKSKIQVYAIVLRSFAGEIDVYRPNELEHIADLMRALMVLDDLANA